MNKLTGNEYYESNTNNFKNQHEVTTLENAECLISCTLDGQNKFHLSSFLLSAERHSHVSNTEI